MISLSADPVIKVLGEGEEKNRRRRGEGEEKKRVESREGAGMVRPD